MHKITVDEDAALIEITLDGLINTDESKLACAALRRALTSLSGRPIKILVDAQFVHPVSQEVAEEFRAVQRYGLVLGLTRVAQVVESSVVLLQRARIMRESGTGTMTRTFRDREAARRWLLSRGAGT
jgi:hypothetical protein